MDLPELGGPSSATPRNFFVEGLSLLLRTSVLAPRMLFRIAAKGDEARNCTSASAVAQRIKRLIAIIGKVTGSSAMCCNEIAKCIAMHKDTIVYYRAKEPTIRLQVNRFSNRSSSEFG